ncbi:MAG: SLC13 family permease [Desulfovibrionaceae bacterium]
MIKRVFVLGVAPIVLFSTMLLLNIMEVEHARGWNILCVTIWMTLWWATSIIPFAITSMLPIILFPIFSIAESKDIFPAYANPIIFLFLGGFLYAIALQRNGLHKRVAINLILSVGKTPSMMILAIMIATAITSMFMSNTVTALMMFPLGIGICNTLERIGAEGITEETMKKFKIVCMLAIGYSASLGGMATIIGSPPNIIAAGILSENFGVEIAFLEWAVVGVPISLLLLLFTWKLFFVQYKVEGFDVNILHKFLLEEKKALGTISGREISLIWIGIFLLSGWILNDFKFIPIISQMSDTQIALIGSILLFAVSIDGRTLIDGSALKDVEWNILYMFGAGFALSRVYSTLPLEQIISYITASFIGQSFLILIFLTISAALITEFTSNSSVAILILPVVAVIATSAGLSEMHTVMAVCFASSCAFMLPTSTPSNAVVFGSGYFTIEHLLKTGVILTVVSGISLALYSYYVMPFLLKV